MAPVAGTWLKQDVVVSDEKITAQEVSLASISNEPKKNVCTASGAGPDRDAVTPASRYNENGALPEHMKGSRKTDPFTNGLKGCCGSEIT
ncbi:unnamed protein product [Boreogadus saida]